MLTLFSEFINIPTGHRMAAARDWGKDASKTDVVCKYCLKEMRKDNIGRHNSKMHPGKKESFSLKTIKGQISLSALLGVVRSSPGGAIRTSSSQEIDVAVESVESMESFNDISSDIDFESAADTAVKEWSAVNDESTNWPGKVVRVVQDECPQAENLQLSSAGAGAGGDDGNSSSYLSSLSEPTKKRHCSGSDGALSDLSKSHEIQKLLTSFKDQIVSDVSELLGKAQLSDKAEVTMEMEGHSAEAEIEKEFINAVHRADNIETLKTVLEANFFTIDSEKKVAICDTCVDDPYYVGAGGFENKAGIFQFDLDAQNTLVELCSGAQSRPFLNLKKSIVRHISVSQTHIKIKEKKDRDHKETAARTARNHEIGLNLFRLRYTGIKQGDSYLNFEKSLLTAHLNKTDVGDTNNSFHFAKDITNHIQRAMQNKFAEKVGLVLEGTNEKRPVGVVADKITPNRRTGHIIGMIVPTPENPMSESFLVPVLLETPPVKDHTAVGLAVQVKQAVNEAGVEDHQIQGGGVDGQYILMGVWDKLLDLLELGDEGMTIEDLRNWVCVIWEPAHNINLADGDVRNLAFFDWLVQLTSCVGDVTATLGIGKGLEQCFDQAEESGVKFYKFKTFSKTRFAPYAESSYSNFEKNFEVTVAVLRERLESRDAKVRDAAARLLNNIQNVTFCAQLCGVIDVYTVLAKTSCAVQQVEQFPFEMRAKLAAGISKLKQMADKFSIVELDSSDWPTLASNLEDLKAGQFHSVELKESMVRKLTRA